ncbi:unnamed protein product [Diplocarpon coronariae]
MTLTNPRGITHLASVEHVPWNQLSVVCKEDARSSKGASLSPFEIVYGWTIGEAITRRGIGFDDAVAVESISVRCVDGRPSSPLPALKEYHRQTRIQDQCNGNSEAVSGDALGIGDRDAKSEITDDAL